MLNVPWTNVKVKNRLESDWVGRDGFLGMLRSEKHFKVAPGAELRIHEVKWGPRNGMVSMDVLWMFLYPMFFWVVKIRMHFWLVHLFFNRGGSKEQLSNTNCLNFCLDDFFRHLKFLLFFNQKRFNQNRDQNHYRSPKIAWSFGKMPYRSPWTSERSTVPDFLGGQVSDPKMYNGGDLPECTGAPKSMDSFVRFLTYFWIHVWSKKCIYFLVYHENQPFM